MATDTSPMKLDMLHAHKLVSLMLDPERGFTAKKLSLNDYATYACAELGFAVTKNQVQTRVREFSIPHGERPEAVNVDMAALAATVLAQGQAIADLTERMTRLEGWVNTTFPSKSPLRQVL